MKTLILLIILVLVAVQLIRGATKSGGGVEEAVKRIGEGALVIDVRSPGEYSSGHLNGSLNIVHDQTEALAKAIGEDKGRSVVLYCRSGNRSGIAQKALAASGYTNIANCGGYKDLSTALPTSR